MKRIKLILTIIAYVLCLAFVFTGCSNSNNNEDSIPPVDIVNKDYKNDKWQLGVSLSMTSAAALCAAADKLTPKKKTTQLKQRMNADEDGRSPLIRLAIRPFSSRRHVHLLMLLYGELIFLFMGLSCPPLPITSAYTYHYFTICTVLFPINTE